MNLSWYEKEQFYHEVSTYTKSGIGLKDALQSMAEGADNGRARQLARRLLRQSANADSLYSTFAAQRGMFSELELALLEAAEQSGRLEQAFRYLGDYFANLHKAKQEVIRRSMYPIFVLHFAILILPLPGLITQKVTFAQYLSQTLGLLFTIYAVVFLVGIATSILVSVSKQSAAGDALLRKFPLVGKVRSSAAYTRFCLAMEMQIQAGISVLQALPVAGRASQSGLIMARTVRAVPRINNGEELAQSLGKAGPLPGNILRGIGLGQEAGTLDEEFRRWGKFYMEQTLNRIRVLSDWLPKIMYFAIAGYVAWRIIGTFKDSMQTVTDLLEGGTL